MDLQAYKRRLGATSSSEALVNASHQQTKSLFKNSPLYKVIKVNDVDKGVRVNYESENERQLLIQPEDSVDKGSIAFFDELYWLVTEFTPSLVFPKAIVTICNEIARWNDGAVLHEYPVVAVGKGYKLQENKKYMRLAEGDVVIKIRYNDETKTIKELQRFIFGDRAYQVTGIDNMSNVLNGVGILELTLELTSKSDTDDIVTDVADDDSTGSSWGGGWS